MQEPGEQIRPKVNETTAVALVEGLYGLMVTTVKQLNSYEDKNFHIQVSDNFANPNVSELWSHGYTLKVLNCLESRNPSLIVAQNQLMEFLRGRNFCCPVTVPTITQEQYSLQQLFIDNFQETEADQKSTFLVRLLTYIPGTLLYNVPYTPQLLRNAGRYLADLHIVMQEFSAPTILQDRSSIWSMASVPHLKNFLFAINNNDDRDLVETIVKAFEHEVETKYSRLPKGLLHGDYNEQNILVERSSENHDYEVCGILDFADAQVSYYVFDISMAVAYLMLDSRVIDPIAAGGQVLAGYCSLRPMIDDEWDVLKVCVASRYCQSLVLGAYNCQLDPNNAYVAITQAMGWSLLRRLWSLPNDQLVFDWKQIVHN